MTLLGELIDAMELIAPTQYAESWDNVGLLVGDRAKAFRRVILTIDYTPAVAAEALELQCDVVIAYHPPIFDGLKSVSADGAGSLVFHAITHGIAIYSPHTALDVAEGGTNDFLADAIGLNKRQPLRLLESKASDYKLVVFVPESALQKVSNAIFAAGAGHIGDYSSCSFRSAGTGTFFGEADSKPAVGESGKLETAPEIRLETVVAINQLAPVLTALRENHPYEEPAFDLNQLAGPPSGVGLGRVGSFDSPVRLGELVARIKRELGLDFVALTAADDTEIKKVALCAGAGGVLLDDAISQAADLYLTGELRHHDAIKATRAGMNVICTLHSNSERGVLKRLKSRLQEKLEGLDVLISQTDRDPFFIK